MHSLQALVTYILNIQRINVASSWIVEKLKLCNDFRGASLYFQEETSQFPSFSKMGNCLIYAYLVALSIGILGTK